MTAPNFRLIDIENAADNFLKSYNPNFNLPIPIEEIVELKLNITIVVVPGIKQLLGIDAFINSEFSQITIDERCYSNYPQRTRFSVAHEIGHFLLHKNWYEKFGPKTLDDYFEFHDNIDAETYKYIEIQASTFAGYLLVPRILLEKQLEEKIGRTPRNENPEILFSVLPDLADIFQVSGEVILRRLQRDRLISPISS
ncbi:MAG: ImmA/IrrE family metallo-endopeptidase [bacterium]|nr:ImmA/IrrE family metallo-endopeptidase [bacterium]